MIKVIAVHMFISFVLFITMVVDWNISKNFAFENGWDIDKCNPIHPIEVWIYFMPIVNVMFTALNLKFNSMLAETKNEEGTVLSVFIGPWGFHYSEWDDAI